jgi:hypothetical protein
LRTGLAPRSAVNIQCLCENAGRDQLVRRPKIAHVKLLLARTYPKPQ